MAIKLVRKKRKNADGSYDIVHYETQAKVVWFEDGESFQDKYDNGELRGQPGDPGYTPQKNVDYFDGQSGKDGTSVTVASVVESTADGGTSVVTFSDGKKLNVKNGSKGSDGAPGYTPQKGTDYWTAADKAEMVDDVLAALPTWTGGSY